MIFIVPSIVMLLVFAGFWFRRHARIHVPCMMMAFLLDFSLVIYLEVIKRVVQSVGGQIVHPVQSHGLLAFHVIVSTLTLVLYGVLMALGFSLLRGKQQSRTPHRRLGYLFLACRLLNYITSFFVVGMAT